MAAILTKEMRDKGVDIMISPAKVHSVDLSITRVFLQSQLNFDSQRQVQIYKHVVLLRKSTIMYLKVLPYLA